MGDKEDRKEIIRLQEATNTSVIAFVLSIFMPLVGLILGIKAHREIKNSDETLTGRAFAVAAMWIGGIGTAIWSGIVALVILGSFGSGHHGFGHGFGNNFGNNFGRPFGGNFGNHRQFNGFGGQGFGGQRMGGQGFGGMSGVSPSAPHIGQNNQGGQNNLGSGTTKG